MRPLLAEQALADVHRLQGVGRSRLTAIWFPLAFFGLIYIGAVPLALVVHRDHLGPYFLVALIASSFATARYYRRSGENDGIETSPWPWLATSIAMIVGGAVASRAGFELHSTFINSSGPFLVVAGVFLAFSVTARSRFLLVDALIMAGICTVAIPIADGDRRIASQAAAFAVLLLLSAGLQYRDRPRPSR